MDPENAVVLDLFFDSDDDTFDMIMEATREEAMEVERRRYRMHRPLFCRIIYSVEAYDSYFTQRKDALGVPGLSSLQKVIAAYRILAYGVPGDFLDDHIRIGESTTIESLRHFVKAIVDIFFEQYLRAPNQYDLTRLLQVNEQCGFPGMLGSIDCMHWSWKNCPTAWQVNGNTYNMGYYLADGIYPSWATFVKTISAPMGLKAKHFAQAQEAARKDIERAFVVLQARFNIVRGPARFWDEYALSNIMKACIIMHNMIIENESDSCSLEFDDVTPNVPVSCDHTNEFVEFIQTHHQIRDRSIHHQLQHDLIEHFWNIQGEDNS